MTFLDLLGLNPLKPLIAYREGEDAGGGFFGGDGFLGLGGELSPGDGVGVGGVGDDGVNGGGDEQAYEQYQQQAPATAAADANAPTTGTPVPPPEFNYVPSPGIAQFYNPKSQPSYGGKGGGMPARPIYQPGPGYGGKGGGMPARPIYQPGPSPMFQPQFYPSQAAAMRSSPFGFSQSRSMGQPGFGRLGSALGGAFLPGFGGVGSVRASPSELAGQGVPVQRELPPPNPFAENAQLQAQQRPMRQPTYGGKGGGMPQRPMPRPSPGYGGKGGGMPQRPMRQPGYGGKGGGMPQRPMRQSGFGGKGGFS